MVLATHLLIRLGLQHQLLLNVVFTNEELCNLFFLDFLCNMEIAIL